MYVSSEDMIQALILYGVSGMGIASFWQWLAEEDDKQWCSDVFIVEEVK